MRLEQLKQLFPRAQDVYLVALVELAPKWGISSTNEEASFIAQLAVESRELTVFEENLNYSAQRLTQIWPKRFPTLESAAPYARNPEKLANHVYSNRLGNGGPETGQGWKYRGRGPIQLTGANNYISCGRGIGQPLFSSPDLLLQPSIGILSALWFWKVKALDLLDDDEDVRRETKIVNGGDHGLARRQAYFDRAVAVLRGAEYGQVG